MPGLTIVNPDVTSENSIAITGRMIHVALKGDTTFTDLGVIESLQKGGTTNTQELKGNRTGKVTTYKKVILEDTTEWTLQTSAYADRAVQRVFNGGVTKTAGTGASAIVSGKEGKVIAYGCSLFTLQDTDADFAIVRAYPAIAFEPDNDVEIQGFSGLAGKITIQAAETFVPPASLVDYTGETTPSGVWYMTSIANVKSVQDALADALLAYMNA